MVIYLFILIIWANYKSSHDPWLKCFNMSKTIEHGNNHLLILDTGYMYYFGKNRSFCLPLVQIDMNLTYPVILLYKAHSCICRLEQILGSEHRVSHLSSTLDNFCAQESKTEMNTPVVKWWNGSFTATVTFWKYPADFGCTFFFFFFLHVSAIFVILWTGSTRINNVPKINFTKLWFEIFNFKGCCRLPFYIYRIWLQWKFMSLV